MEAGLKKSKKKKKKKKKKESVCIGQLLANVTPADKTGENKLCKLLCGYSK